ncbi:Eco57I restriction-modification methylase domain-containing protein [Ligilactobacillus animalis]
MTEKDQFKFDVVIGNPPYQEEQKSTDIESSKKNYASPIYNLFIDEVYEVGKKLNLSIRLVFCLMQGQHQRSGIKKCLMTHILRLFIMNLKVKKCLKMLI